MEITGSMYFGYGDRTGGPHSCYDAFYVGSTKTGRPNQYDSTNAAADGVQFRASRNWTGSTSTQSASHNHTVTVNTSGPYGDGTTVQPNAYVMKVYKRTA